MKLIIDVDEGQFKDIKRIAVVQLELNHYTTAEQIIANGKVVPDNLQGWRYEETPYEIPTFNRKELEKARDYWYSHLEVGNEEQNEAAWAAINAIKYCIEHSSSYQEEGGAE